MKSIMLTLTLSFTFIAIISLSQPGSLDSSFGKNGKALNMNVGGSSVAIQADGKILVTGTYNDFSVQRFTTNGKIDKGFGNNGKASTSFEPFGYGLHASLVAVEPGGKILLAGSVWNGDYFETHLCLARFKKNGLLDSSFGTDGHVEIPIGNEGNEDVSDLVIQPDGKMIVTIWQYMNFHQGRTAAIRFTSKGDAETYFNADASVHDLCYGASLQSDGKLLVTGSIYKDPFGDQFALFRFTQIGWLDYTFGDSGVVTTGRHSAGAAVAVQTDDKIVALTKDSLLARFQKNGIADSSFNNKGRITIPFQGNALAIQQDGKIIVAGSMYNGTNNDFALARYKANGKLDKSFGTSGLVITDFGSSEGAADVVIQTDGKIIASGSGDLVRYKGDSISFNTNLASSSLIAQNVSPVIKSFPNPVQSVLNIEFKAGDDAIKMINIYDVKGNLLIKRSAESSTQLDLRSLAKGPYLLKISGDDGKLIYSGKLIKE